MASFFRTYRITKDGQRIDGVFAMAFIHDMQDHLTPISTCQDGMINCWGVGGLMSATIRDISRGLRQESRRFATESVGIARKTVKDGDILGSKSPDFWPLAARRFRATLEICDVFAMGAFRSAQAACLRRCGNDWVCESRACRFLVVGN